MPIPLYAMGAYIHVSSELRSCRTEPQEEELSLAGRRRRRRHEMETNRIPHPDLKLQELDVVDGLLEHGAHVHLGAVGHQALQHLEPLVDPLPPLLHHHHHHPERKIQPFVFINRTTGLLAMLRGARRRQVR